MSAALLPFGAGKVCYVQAKGRGLVAKQEESMEITKRRLADIVPYAGNAKSMINGKSTMLRRASSSTALCSRL